MKDRIYVKVKSAFDETGYMYPVSIVLGNKVLPVESIRDYRPATSKIGCNQPGDCYTVIINGEEKNLFFQKTDPLFSAKVGRWFIDGETWSDVMR